MSDARQRISASLVVRGDPGIGKSALLRYAEGQAKGMRVLRTIGVDAESELPFAALHELLLPVLDLIAELPDVQRTALSAALAIGPPASVDRLAVSAATLAMLAEAAEASSLLCTIDDAHWLDSASAEAILFACRRLRAEGIVVLLAAREGERVRFEAPGIPNLMLGGLDRDAAHSVLQRAGVPLAPQVAEQLIQITDGNPLALVEVPRALRPEQRTGREPLAEPLPVGEGIQQAFLGRVRALSQHAQMALLVASASDTPDLGTVAQAIERLGRDVSDLDESEAVHLVAMSRGRIAFRHPLVRSAVYEAADPALRRSAHRALAAVGSRHAESRAWHLAAATSGPNAEVADALEAAARAANDRGAPAVAAWSFDRAAALTPDDEGRARRLLAAGTASWLAGRSDRALEQLTSALDATVDPGLRADIQLMYGRTLTWASDVTEAYSLLVSEAERIESIDRTRASVMLCEAVMSCMMAGQIVKGIETGRRAESLAKGGPAHLFASAVLAVSLSLHGEPIAREYLTRCQLALQRVDSPEAYQLGAVIAQLLMLIEEFDTARPVLDRIVAARAHGIVNPFALASRAEFDYRTGQWAACYADASESVDIARESGQRSTLTFCLMVLARVEATTGRELACRAHVAEGYDLAESQGVDSQLTYAGSVLGLLELGLGRPDLAVGHLEPVARLVEQHGVHEPAVVQWAPDLIEAYARIGRTSEAGAALAKLERQAHRTGRTWAQATSARCRGLLSPEDAFDDEFAEALRWHARTPTPFERARTEVCYGERLRRVGRRVEARERLRSALATFESLGAEPWAERAHRELRSTGERLRKRSAPATAALTAQELQVALLVADGATNREAGERLFLSPRTIEFHLRNAYAKLGVRSRTELASRLAAKDAAAITT